MAKFRFRPHIIDRNLPGRLYAQTALADFDQDGVPEFITGQQYGTLFRYRRQSSGLWTRHMFSERSRPRMSAPVCLMLMAMAGSTL